MFIKNSGKSVPPPKNEILKGVLFIIITTIYYKYLLIYLSEHYTYLDDEIKD